MKKLEKIKINKEHFIKESQKTLLWISSKIYSLNEKGRHGGWVKNHDFPRYT